MLGKLTWDAIPWDQPIPLIAGAVGASSPCSRSSLGDRQGPPAVSVARVDHQRRPQAHRRHVRAARPGDAAARLHRRAHDALAAGARLPRRRLSAARALRSDLLGARHDHDLLRRDAADDRADELRRAAAARRARRRVPDPQLDQLLAHRDRRALWSTSRWSSASSPAPAGCPIRRCRRPLICPASASTITSGRCRSPASAR